MNVVHVRVALLKACIVLVPSYTAAYLTDKMVWVIPTLAAAGFLAATLGVDEADTQKRRTIRRLDDNDDASEGVEFDLQEGSSYDQDGGG